MNPPVSLPSIEIWTNPASESGKPSLFYLRPDEFGYAVVAADDLEQTTLSLKGGGKIAATSIPLKVIVQLEGTADTDEVTITYKQGDLPMDPLEISLGDAAQRDALVAALGKHLGPDWEYRRHRQNRFFASLWPLAASAVVTLVTLTMYHEVTRMADGHVATPGGFRRSRLIRMVMQWIEGILGPYGVLVVGGLIVASCVVWLIVTLAQPPLLFTLAKRREG